MTPPAPGAVSDTFGTGVLLGLLGQPAHVILGVLVGGILHERFARGVHIDIDVLDTLLALPALTQLLWMLPLALVLRRSPRARRGLFAVAALVAVGNGAFYVFWRLSAA